MATAADVATITFIKPVAATPPPGPHSPKGNVDHDFETTNYVKIEGLQANATVIGTAEFSIACEGPVDPDTASSNYVSIGANADGAGLYERSFTSKGKKPLMSSETKTATATASWNLNVKSITAPQASVTFFTNKYVPPIDFE